MNIIETVRGELISKIEYDANGTVVESSEYIPSDMEYDADGNLISKISYSSDGSVSKTYEYEYSEDGTELYYSYTNFSTGKNEYKKRQSIAEYLAQKVSVTYPDPSELEYLILKTTEGNTYYSDSEGIHEYSYSYTKDYDYDENGNPDGMTINYEFDIFDDGTVTGDFEVDSKGNVIRETDLGFSVTDESTLNVYTITSTYTYYDNGIIRSQMVENNDDNTDKAYCLFDEYGIERQYIYNFYSEEAATGYYYINKYDDTGEIPSEVVQTGVEGTFIYNSADNMYYFYDSYAGFYYNITYDLSFNEDGYLMEKHEDGSSSYYTREYDSDNRIISVKSYGTYNITTFYDSDVLELGSTSTYVYGTVSDLQGENANNSMETAEVVAIEADHKEEDGYEYTIICAYDSDYNIVWSYQTGQYMLADMPRLNDIGLNGDYYYYSEYGKIIALDKNTGTIMWENTSLTSGTKTYLHTFDEEGNLYGYGVIEPECDLTFFAIDINGNLLGTIDQSSFIYTYLGAVSLEVYDGQAIVVVEDYEYGGTTTFYIDLSTFACSTEPNTVHSSSEIIYDDNTLIYNGNTYKFINDSSYTWKEAKEYCESLSGHLVTITSEGEQDAVYSFIKDKIGDEDVYIGLSDMDEDGVWNWVTEEELSYTNWAEGEPDSYHAGQIYAAICNGTRSGSKFSITPGKWDDVSDDDDFVSGYFICEWEHTEPSSDENTDSGILIINEDD